MMPATPATIAFSIVGPSDPAWARAVGHAPHDVYQRPEWCEVHAQLDRGEPLALHATDGRDDFIFPFVRRSVESEFWDAVSPYGYPGYVLSEAAAPAFLGSVLEAAPAFLEAAGCVTVFGRLNPLDDPPPGPGYLQRTGTTVAVDLQRTEQEYRASIRKGHRYDVRRATKEGVRVVTTSGLDADVGEFHAIYSETMERLDADDYYRLPLTYFESLRDRLGPDLMLARARLGTATLGASLFLISRSSRRIHYHFSATRAEYLHLQPSKAILDHVIVSNLAGAYTHLHLGGGRGAGDDRLLHFKQGFGDTLLGYCTLRMITNPARYRELSGSDTIEGFFPAYRRPQVRS
ncbi:GNAT family N-acetyltransferase [Georgenia sp. Marseille-Q6866]